MKKQSLKKIASLLFYALATASVPADILSPDMASTDALGQINSMETRNGFSAQFWLTTDEQIFLNWSKTGAIRNLKPALQVKRNIPVYLPLFMANPGVKSTVSLSTGKVVSNSDVTFDVYLLSPGGVLSLANKGRVAWKGTPPPAGLATLVTDRGALNFEAIDPLGEYTIVLVIRDNVRKVELKLSRKLEVVE